MRTPGSKGGWPLQRSAPFLLAGLCALSSACASDRAFLVQCRVFGALDQEAIEYAQIVEGELLVEPARLKRTPSTPDGCCSVSDASSEVFGDPAGTTLQITASRCGSRGVYVTSRVKLNGLPVYAHMVGKTSRVVFNEDDFESHEPPITVPEGRFKFIYADCDKKPAPGP